MKTEVEFNTKPTKEVLEILDLIEHNFEQSLGKISRFDLKWGMWSADMNLELRNRIDNDHPDSLFYKYLFIYWVNRSALLQLHYEKPKFMSGAKKMRLRKDGKEIRKSITEGLVVRDDRFDLAFTELVGSVLKSENKNRGLI